MKAFVRPKTLFTMAVCTSASVLLLAEPVWWSQRGVKTPGKAASDYAAINQGQLKNLARAARDEMNERLVGGAGDEVNQLVDGWGSSPSAVDYAAVNQGQLKNLAKVFYDRLIATGRATSYPWTTVTSDDKDYALANIGQAKALFSFEVFVDADHDGFDDIWQAARAAQQGASGTGSGTGLDSDGDGFSDAQEVIDQTDPNSAASNAAAVTGLVVWAPPSGGVP